MEISNQALTTWVIRVRPRAKSYSTLILLSNLTLLKMTVMVSWFTWTICRVKWRRLCSSTSSLNSQDKAARSISSKVWKNSARVWLQRRPCQSSNRCPWQPASFKNIKRKVAVIFRQLTSLNNTMVLIIRTQHLMACNKKTYHSSRHSGSTSSKRERAWVCSNTHSNKPANNSKQTRRRNKTEYFSEFLQRVCN